MHMGSLASGRVRAAAWMARTPSLAHHHPLARGVRCKMAVNYPGADEVVILRHEPGARTHEVRPPRRHLLTYVLTAGWARRMRANMQHAGCVPTATTVTRALARQTVPGGHHTACAVSTHRPVGWSQPPPSAHMPPGCAVRQLARWLTLQGLVGRAAGQAVRVHPGPQRRHPADVRRAAGQAGGRGL